MAHPNAEYKGGKERHRIHKTLGTQQPRNPTEALFYEKYGTVTPIPEGTQHRKSSVQVACILYIHQGMSLTEACRLAGITPKHGEKCRSEDKWDTFMQDLAQLAKPSNLSMIQQHDLTMLQNEQTRREKQLAELIAMEEECVAAAKSMPKGSHKQSIALGNVKKLREMIGEVTGLTNFLKEMSSARTAGLQSAARSDKSPAAGKRAKGQVIDLEND